ncbi:MAG: MMPL family transporter, partial [Acidobacteria bacterium]|nr:MMPL family transporter [Acidobacteriota bacterium]
FSPEGLAFLNEVTSELERVPTVQRVQSLANANVVQAVGDGIEVKPLLGPGVRTADEAGRIRARALSDPLIQGDLVSTDGSVTAIVVTFDEDRVDEIRASVIDRIHAIVESRLPAGAEAFFNGSLEISEAYNRVTLSNQRTFVPPILALTLIALYASFRSVRKTLLAFVAILMSLLWTLGAYSLIGFTYNVLASMIVPLIVVIAVADDVHIMQRFEQELQEGRSREDAFRNTVRHLATPLLGASATTALGMLSLATSEVKAVREFGIGSAVGIMIDFAISLVFVPTVMARMKPEKGLPPHHVLLVQPMRRVAALATRRPALILGLSLASAFAAILGINRLHVDTNHINFFSKSHPLSRSADVIDRQLSGIYSFQILLEGPPDSLQSPDVLRRMDALEDGLRRLPFVKKTTSVAQYVKRINQELHDGVPAQAVVPASQHAVAQELLVFSLSDAGRHELERLVASDFSRAQIAVKLASMSSDLVFAQINEAERMAREAFEGTGIKTEATGSGRLFSTLDHYLVMSQVSSFATAFVTVFGVIFIVFRSVRFGVLAIVANAVPVLAVLGLMGWFDISLNVATVMVASVALGVVDDDTIHFISRFRHETARGATAEQAIATATVHEGRASLTGAFINSLGYGVLMLSEYKPTAWFGMLLAITMAVAFLAEVLIVPAIIMLFPRVFAARATGGG